MCKNNNAQALVEGIGLGMEVLKNTLKMLKHPKKPILYWWGYAIPWGHENNLPKSPDIKPFNNIKNYYICLEAHAKFKK